MKDIVQGDLPDFADVMAAKDRIAPYIMRTPVLVSQFLNDLAGAELHFKCENFQPVGAFKIRGASNAVFSLSDDVAARGVCTHSSGNHALSLSFAAQQRGIPCYVVMPNTAPNAKKEAVLRFGGRITECAPSISAREATLAGIADQTKATFVHPYNDMQVIAGQGTCSLELLDDIPALDMIVAPIGGGGMISGTCLSVGGRSPATQVIAAEPEQADDAYRSFKSGQLVQDDAPVTVADGLKVPLKEKTWHFVSNHVSEILTASEQEIIDAMKLSWQHLRIVMEASCAVPLAVILKNPGIFGGRRVGVIVTGGNVDLDTLPWIA